MSSKVDCIYTGGFIETSAESVSRIWRTRLRLRAKDFGASSQQRPTDFGTFRRAICETKV